MSRRAWVRLDNASNMFLAARSEIDPKVFRVGAEMDHEVDPQLLQEALEAIYDRYRLYHAVLRRGVFWYYLQDSDLRPRVTADELPPCAPIYQADRRTLLFRVTYHERRINLEVFHALSDGTGALWFLADLLTVYVRLRYPDRDRSLGQGADAAAPRSDADRALADPPPPDDVAEPVHELTTDSFAYYFLRRRRRRRRRHRPDPWETRAAFSSEAPPTPLAVEDSVRGPTAAARVHRVRGTRTPDSRTRVVELTMPASQVLDLARAEEVALTMYLTGVFFESVRRSSGGLGSARTLAASVPVNLRQFFPSTSARNFFATTRVEHTYGEGPDDLGAVCRQLERDFRSAATPESLERKLRRFIRFERMPALRVVPRPLKDVILGLVNRSSNRGLSVAVSNLGRVSLPEPAAAHVRRLLFQVSAVRPQFCAISHAGLLTVSFTSPYLETDHVREFARILTAAGVDVTVAAARVTEQELAEAESAKVER
ncbi:alcohol acetyltransferase [Brachybacterium sp. FME24]|uniref:alcohol acetyltransferase n=1 Tax=Brachybacterium sp. FME24 TaxID=2742605 RepID=UPI001866D579|nr:alcohol acetyltransferase [Brachybacterium sp. FME24]